MIKVLVAEDDKFLRNAYRIKLSKEGFDVKIATDGKEAIEALGVFIPDIILLDLVMPQKDGFSVLEDIRKNETYKHIPVIVASNLGQKEDLDRAKSLGSTDYIIKSDLSLRELIEKIHRIVKK